MPMPLASIFSIEITLKDQKSITDPIQLHKLKGQATCNTIGAIGHLPKKMTAAFTLSGN